jgi:hypothetical protein
MRITRVNGLGFRGEAGRTAVTEQTEVIRRLCRANRTTVKSITATVLFAAWAMMSACVPYQEGGTGQLQAPDPNGGDDFILKEIELENAHFVQEPTQNGPMKPALMYWVRTGERIGARWDAFELHWERQKKMCSFADNSSAGDCQVNDVCLPCPQNGLPCLGGPFFLAPGYLDVVQDLGFFPHGDSASLLSYTSAAQIIASCTSNANASPQWFAPNLDGLYRLSSTDPNVFFRGDAHGEADVFAISQGRTQGVAFQLTRETIDGTDYWKFKVTGDSMWRYNFSPNLRVTDIRIYKGKCQPHAYTVQECNSGFEEIVKPSRVLFLPGFGEPGFADTVNGFVGLQFHRCYSVPGFLPQGFGPDGYDPGGNYINLDACRDTYNTSAQVPTSPRIVTPTYDPFYTGTPADLLTKQTWLVEFNTNEGADADERNPGNDPMPTDAELIISFDIVAQP